MTQVEAILPLLKRGVGIHHGGLLPILKEVIEILFQVSRRWFTLTRLCTVPGMNLDNPVAVSLSV